MEIGYGEKCLHCVWSRDTGGVIFCMFPKCPFYKFVLDEKVMKPTKKCKTCRKQSKCSRSTMVEGCELYSPDDMSFCVRTCAECGSTFRVEEHHIFGAANRKRSDNDGLTVDLCADCHRNNRNAVHQSAETAKKYKKLGQVEFEKAYGEGSFLEKYGRNYI